MTQTAERLKAELSMLSPEERAQLAHFLIYSLDAEEDLDAEAAWDGELAQRAEEIETEESAGEPADQALTELRQKYS